MTIVRTKIYLLKDSQGNRASATCEEGCDIVQICGLKDKTGKDVYFESDAYHLGTFSRDNNIDMKIIDREEDFDKLWETGK